jgi:excisionase family DNA binding protein
MSTGVLEPREAVLPTEEDRNLAKESIKKLSRFGGQMAQPKNVSVRICPDDEEGDFVPIPHSAFRILSDILTEMARGNAVTLIPIHAELSTQKAADILNVSRPFLIRLLEQKLIKFRKVGSHRRIMYRDLMDYKHKADSDRREALKQITDESEQLGLEY